MLLMRVDNIGHRTLDFPYDVQVHDYRFCFRVDTVESRRDLARLQRFDPIDIIARRCLRQAGQRIFWRLQRTDSGAVLIMYTVLCWGWIALRWWLHQTVERVGVSRFHVWQIQLHQYRRRGGKAKRPNNGIY